MVTWFDTITLINSDGRIAEIDTARIVIDGNAEAARIYLEPKYAPEWEHEGMEVVIADEDSNVLFSGQILAVDKSQQCIGESEENARLYRCLND